MTLPDSVTLGEARSWLRERALKQGSPCPCCSQMTKVYRRSMHAAMGQALITMHRTGGTDWVYLPSIGGRGGDASKLRYWGLIEEEQTLRPDGGRAGYWRVTRKGSAFVRGEVTVPRYAHVYDGRCIRLDGPMVDIRDVLAKRFNYDALMRGEG